MCMIYIYHISSSTRGFPGLGVRAFPAARPGRSARHAHPRGGDHRGPGWGEGSEMVPEPCFEHEKRREKGGNIWLV